MAQEPVTRQPGACFVSTLARAVQALGKVDPHILELVCAEILDRRSAVTWEDIAGQDTAKRLVQELVVWPMLNPHLFKGARAPPKGLLLFGPPGAPALAACSCGCCSRAPPEGLLLFGPPGAPVLGCLQLWVLCARPARGPAALRAARRARAWLPAAVGAVRAPRPRACCSSGRQARPLWLPAAVGAVRARRPRACCSSGRQARPCLAACSCGCCVRAPPEGLLLFAPPGAPLLWLPAAVGAMRARRPRACCSLGRQARLVTVSACVRSVAHLHSAAQHLHLRPRPVQPACTRTLTSFIQQAMSQRRGSLPCAGGVKRSLGFRVPNQPEMLSGVASRDGEDAAGQGGCRQHPRHILHQP